MLRYEVEHFTEIEMPVIEFIFGFFVKFLYQLLDIFIVSYFILKKLFGNLIFWYRDAVGKDHLIQVFGEYRVDLSVRKLENLVQVFLQFLVEI